MVCKSVLTIPNSLSYPKYVENNLYIIHSSIDLKYTLSVNINITSLERRSLKSTASKLIRFIHSLAIVLVKDI